MRIVVMTFKGAPLAEPIQAEFGAGGGTIGREAGNRLMLPDPERHISRVQARVLVEGGSYMLEDLGGNPTLINDRPVGRGTRVPLTDGDRVCVGQYEMRVDQSRAQAPGAGAVPNRLQPARAPGLPAATRSGCLAGLRRVAWIPSGRRRAARP